MHIYITSFRKMCFFLTFFSKKKSAQKPDNIISPKQSLSWFKHVHLATCVFVIKLDLLIHFGTPNIVFTTLEKKHI